MRRFAIGLTLPLLIATSAAAGQSGTAGADPAEGLQRVIGTITARMDGGKPTPQQVRADAQLLTAGYRSMGPGRTAAGPGGDARMRDLGRRSLDWLARASRYDRRDPATALLLLDSYDSIGGFYRQGSAYPAGAIIAYAAAMRLAQRLMFEAADPARFEQEYARFALACGTMTAAQGSLVVPWQQPQDAPAGPLGEMVPAALEPVPLPPPIDQSQLDPEQRAAYVNARERFRNVAPKVHQARLLLKDLSQRQTRLGVALNPEDAANALKMHGFVEEAADLIKTGKFSAASDALDRADYVRNKLRSATGQ